MKNNKLRSDVNHTKTLNIFVDKDKKSYKLLTEASDYLKGKKVTGISIRPGSIDGNSVDKLFCSDGLPLVPDAILANAFLSLRKNSTDIVEKIPVSYFFAFLGIGEYVPLSGFPCGIDLGSSSIEFTQPNFKADFEALTSDKYAIEITFFYEVI